MSNPILTIKIEKGDEIKVELFADRAPFSVEFFLSYVNMGYYDGLPFHAILDGEYIQCGYHGHTGYGAPPFTYEETDEKVKPQDEMIPCAPQMFAFIESKYPYLAKMQIAILFTDKAIFSEGHEVVFKPIGRVISGYEYAQRIAKSPVDPDFAPISPVIVEHIIVE